MLGRAAAALLIAAVLGPAPAQACAGIECLLTWSTADGGGALTIEYDFAGSKVQTFRAFCGSGTCLYSAIDPGFLNTGEMPPDGRYVLAAGTALAGGHTWDVNEVFSNADGTIQFIELREANGTPGETGTAGKVISSVDTGKTFTMTSNVASPTSNRHILLATATFAALPGAPTPDYIIPVGSLPFFDVTGDQVKYSTFDTFTFGPVPLDGLNSMNRTGGAALNSPTNYAGQTGSVDASGGGVECSGDLDGDGDSDLDDLLLVLGAFGVNNGGDADGDGDTDLDDLLIVLGDFGCV